QRRHNSQTRQMNRPVNSGAGGSQLRRPLHSGRNAISSATAASAGSIDEEGFLAAFEQVPKINVYSNRDAIECLNRIRDTLSSSASEDWEKRVDAMKQLRSLLLAGGPEFEDFLPTLRSLAVPFRGCISDLRSQVVREACITIAHLASCLGNRFDQFAEPIMEPLLALLGNTAKIVATCGMVCTSLLLRYTQSHRLLPSLLALGQAKSAIQRRCVAELMADQVLASWPAHALERQLPGLLDWLRRCLTDADQEARSNGRRAFWRFGRQFWAQAASILNGCDSRTRAAIERVRPSDMPAPAAPGATAASRAPQSTPASRGASPPRSGRGGPRSQASSRGSSPPRSGIPVPMNSSTPAPAGSSSLRRSSQGAGGGGGGGGSISARSSFRGGRQRVEQQAAAQSALAEALQFKLQQRRQTGDGDDASETSSVCSDASFKSFTNLAEILAQLQSSEWSCRRDGLASFSSYLAREGGPSLNQLELRRVCDIFAKMFGEPNGRVMQFFLEALADFVTRYHGELHDWLYTLLVRLVGRMATETLASQQARFQTAMERVQRAFPITLQLRCLLRFLIDQNQQPSPRVQAALLQCLLQVVRQLPADALVPWRNQSDQPGQEARIALSRLTTLTKDPKSPDVRRLSQAVLAALFDLNPGCFSAVLKEMQPTIQQRATDVLKLQLGPKAAGVGSDIPASAETPQKQQQVSGPPSSAAATPAPLSARGGVARPAAAVVRRAAPATPAAAAAANAAADAGDGSDDLLNSVHRAALNLQSFTRTAEDADATENKAPIIEALPAPTPVRPAQLANGRAPASALQPSRQQQQQQPPLTAGGPRQQQATVAEVTSTPSRFQPVQKQQQQQQQQAPPAPPPAALQSTLGQPDFEDFDDDEELLDDDDEDIDEMSTDDAVTGILKELSNHNQRHEQRMSSMQRLVRMVRDNSVDSWDENFKTVLLILLETLGDNEADIRALALTVLQELIRAQPRRLSNYTELTLLKILEAHRDTDKLVAKAAEDCAKHVAAHLPGDVCLRVLTPLVSGADPGLALAAVKMQMRVVQECEPVPWRPPCPSCAQAWCAAAITPSLKYARPPSSV
ncbi:hypothetical protein BOX15_Mlig024343g1, partial [Macrostomum lignano]